MTGNSDKLANSRPNEEPLFSAASVTEFPTTKKFSKVHYEDFIKYHSYDGSKSLIWQSIFNAELCSVFSFDKRYRNKQTCNLIGENSEDFLKRLNIRKMTRYSLFALSADESSGKFYAHMMKDFGTHQTVVKSESADDLVLLNLQVTACASYGSMYFFVLTGGAADYDRRRQKFLTAKTKDGLTATMMHCIDNGMIITSICYNHGKQEYLAIMTGSQQEQVWGFLTTLP